MKALPKCFGLSLVVLLWLAGAGAQSLEDCLMCHEDPELTTDRAGRQVSLFVDLDVFSQSIHGDFDCITCHPSSCGG